MCYINMNNINEFEKFVYEGAIKIVAGMVNKNKLNIKMNLDDAIEAIRETIYQDKYGDKCDNEL